MGLKPIRTKAPTQDLIETAAARKHCNIDHSDDDDILAATVVSVRDHLSAPEGVLRVVLLKETWQQPLPDFPVGPILLPLDPVLEIKSVEYIAAGETTWSTMSADDWESFTTELGTWVTPIGSWPDTAGRTPSVRVTFDAGHAKPADIPQSIVHAAKLMLGHFYENREATVLGITAQDLPMGVKALLSPWFRIPV